MRDKRFDHRPDAVVQRIDLAKVEAQTILDNLKNQKNIFDEIIRWTKTLSTRGSEKILGKIVLNKEDHFPLLRMENPKLEVSLSRVIAKGGFTEDAFDFAASWLVGKALAASVLPSMTLATLSPIFSFLELDYEAWTQFKLSVVSICRSNAKLKDKWISLLSVPLEIDRDVLKLGRSKGEQTLNAEIKLYEKKDEIDFYRLWDEPNRHSPVLLSVIAEKRLSLLRDLDSIGFIKIVEALPIPHLVESVLQEFGVTQNNELILEILRLATATFDKKNRWTGQFVGAQAVRSILDYALALRAAVESRLRQSLLVSNASGSSQQVAPAISTLMKEEIPLWFDSAFSALIQRTDGVAIASAFAIYLSYEIRRVKSLNPEEDVRVVALIRLLDLLAKANVPPEAYLQVTGDLQSRLASLGPHLEFFSVMTAIIADSQQHAEIWARYKSMLTKGNYELLLQMNPGVASPNWIFEQLGLQLVQLPNPEREVKALWTDLYDERFRSRILDSHESYQYSLHALTTFTFALGWLISDKCPVGTDGPELAKRIWIYIRDELTKSYLSVESLNTAAYARQLMILYAYLPHVFQSNWGDQLRSQVDLFRADPEIAILIISLLVTNNINKEELNSLLKEQSTSIEELSTSLELLIHMKLTRSHQSINISDTLSRLKENRTINQGR